MKRHQSHGVSCLEHDGMDEETVLLGIQTKSECRTVPRLLYSPPQDSISRSHILSISTDKCLCCLYPEKLASGKRKSIAIEVVCKCVEKQEKEFFWIVLTRLYRISVDVSI